MFSNYLLRVDRLVKFGLLGLLFYIPLTTGAGYFEETKGIIFAVSSLLSVSWLLLEWEEGSLIPFFRHYKLIIGLMIFFIAFGISFLFHPINLYDSLGSLFLVTTYFITFIIIVSRLRKDDEKYYFIWTLTIVGALVAVKALLQYFYEFRILAEHIASQDIPLNLNNRAFATFVSPNALAGFLLLVFPLSLTLSETAKDAQKKLFAFVLSLLIICGLVLTFSRGGWAITAILLVLLISFATRQIRTGILSKILVFILVGGAFIGLGTYFYPQLETSFLQLLSGRIILKSFAGRVSFWVTAWRILKTYPLRGSGLGTFASISPQFQLSGSYSQHAHNSYVEMFAEVGFIGGSIFIFLLAVCYIRAISSLKQVEEPRDKAIALSLCIGAFGFFLHNLFDFTWYVPASSLFFWTFLGLTLSMAKSRDGMEKPIERKHNLVIKFSLWITMIVIAIILAWKFVSLSEAGEYAQLGKAALRAAKWDAAVINLKKAVDLNPLNAEYRFQLAQGYSGQVTESGNKKGLIKAVKEMEKAIKLQPRSAKFYGTLGSYYFQLDNAKKALEKWKIAKRLYPKNPLFYTLSGKALLQLGKRKDAIREFEAAVSLAKLYAPGKVGIPLLRREVQPEPKSIYDAFLHLAALAWTEGRVRDAQDLYNKAISFNPQDIAAYDGLAVIYTRQGQYDKAIKIYRKIKEINLGNLAIHYKLAYLYEQIGHYQQAAEEYQRILKVKPKSQEAKEGLDRVLQKIE